MGNFYTNFTLRGPEQEAVVKALAGRSAMVTPKRTGCVVVFDEECDEQDMELIATVGKELSGKLDCPVLAVLNHDDDVLWYQLWWNGELADEYNSCPSYFEASEEPSGPAGGNAEKLCSAFGSSNVELVSSVLRKSSFEEGGHVFAVERHAALAQALGIPEFGVGAGFNYVEGGEIPEGLDAEELVRVR